MDRAKHIFWIASYPKSGNTWVRNIISKLFFNASSFSDTLNYVRSIYDIRSQKDIWDSPEINLEKYNFSFLKTHAEFSKLPLSYLDVLITTVGFIYIYRHPLDVLISAINYWRKDINAENFFFEKVIKTPEELLASGQINDYLRKFSESLCIDYWKDMSGTWENNLKSWVEASKKYKLSAIISYESLLDSPLIELQKLKSIFPSLTDNQIIEALEYSNKVTKFDPIKDHITLKDFKKTFFWKMQKGTYKKFFDDTEIKNFISKHRDLLIDFKLIDS